MGIGTMATVVPAACVRNSSSKEKSTHKDGPMTLRENHNSGDKVSLLGYGCMRLPLIQGGNDTEDSIDQEEVNRLTDYALKHGVNYFDTAPVYCKGRSETAMGIALSRHPRDSYFLATKMSNFKSETWPYEKSVEIFENSLKNLRTDYVDYLLLHAIGDSRDGLDSQQTFNARFIDNGILDYLKQQKAKGRIRNLGFSYHGDCAIFDRLLKMMDNNEVHWDFVQIQLNYIDWNHAHEINESNTNASYLYEELKRRNIPAVIMEPLLGGRLANVPASVAGRMRTRRPDDSVASWAFRYAGTPEGILTVLSGMTYMEHLQDNIRTYSSLEPVSAEEKEFLENAAQEIILNNQIPCTACSYCMPCPYGVDIPGIFAHYNKCVNDDNLPRNEGHEHYREARRAFLAGYDRSVPRLRQAAHCIGCNTCVQQCPQGIAIPDRLHEIDQYAKNLRANRLPHEITPTAQENA